MEQLSGLDAMFINAELHGLPMHISSLSIYDPATSSADSVEFKDVLNIFENKVQNNVPILKKRLIPVPGNVDTPYWEDDPNFDLVYHVRHIALPKPGNWEKLCSLVANLHAQPIDRNRPLWEAYVIDGLDAIEGIPENAFAVLLKVHHAVMDGRTGMAIYMNLHSFTPDIEPIVSTQSRPTESPSEAAVPVQAESKSAANVLGNAYVNNIKKTTGLFKMAGKGVSLYTKIRLGKRTKELKSLEKPKTRFNGTISPRRSVDRVKFSMDDVKTIKGVYAGETINDVALTIIGGALRQYLLAKDELPEDSLVAGVPVDVRTKDDEDKNGNMINIMNVALRTDMEDPLERLKMLHKEGEYGKAYAKTLGDHLVNDVLDNVYSGLVSWGIKTAVESGIMDKFPPVNNTIVTNVPGFPCPVYMAGAKLVESFGMGPLVPNTGLFHTVSTTVDTLCIGITACREMMDDPGFYIECLQDSFDELLESAKEFRKPHLVKSELLQIDDEPVKKSESRVSVSKSGSKEAKVEVKKAQSAVSEEQVS